MQGAKVAFFDFFGSSSFGQFWLICFSSAGSHILSYSIIFHWLVRSRLHPESRALELASLRHCEMRGPRC